MFESLTVSSGQNLFRLIQADGHVKKYTIHAALTVGMIFPLSWLFYYWDAPVWTACIIFIIDFMFLNIVRFFDMKRLMPFSIRRFIQDVFIPCLTVSITSFTLPLVICYYMKSGLLRFFINVPISVLWTLGCCLVFGFTRYERQFFSSKFH